MAGRAITTPDIAQTADDAAALCLTAAQDGGATASRSRQGDLRSPSPQVVLRCEERAEEWHYDESMHRYQFDELRAVSGTMKERQRRAKDKHAHAAEVHDAQVAEILASAEAEEQRCAMELARLREELVDAQHHIDEMEEFCEQEVVRIDNEMRTERQRRASLEAELKKEKETIEKATRYITEMEDREGQLMRSKRSEMAKMRSDCREECLEIQKSGDAAIRELGRALRDDVDAIQKQIDQKMKDTQCAVDGWVEQRQKVAADAEKEISQAVDTKVYQGLAAVQMQMLEARETSLEQIKEVQARDFEQEKSLRDRISAALVSVDCSLHEREQVTMLEKSRKKQICVATEILGGRLSPNDNRRLRKAGASAIGAI